MTGGGFVMVPDWLRAKRPSGTAVLAYINLCARGTWNPGAGTYDECRPSMPTLAGDMGVSESTAKRAVADLVDLGAAIKSLRWNEDGSPAPSVYRLVFGVVTEPADPGGGVTGEPTPGHPRTHPGVTHEPTLGSPVTGNQEPNTKNPTPTSPSTPVPPAAGPQTEGGGGGGDDPPDSDQQLAAVVAEVRRHRKAWTARSIQAAIHGAVDVDGRDRPEVFAAVVQMAQDPRTRLPRRLREEAWWADRERRALTPDLGLADVAAADHAWCGECPKATRIVTAGSLDPHAPDPRRAIPCPNCGARKAAA